MIFHNHFKQKISRATSEIGIILAFISIDEQSIQAILDARILHPDCSLADLYDEVTMPPELRKAHQQNAETECVAELMKMYQKLTSI